MTARSSELVREIEDLKDQWYNVGDIQDGCPVLASKLFEDLNSALLLTDLFRWRTKSPVSDLTMMIPKSGKATSEFWSICKLLFYDSTAETKAEVVRELRALLTNPALLDYFVTVGFPTIFMHFAAAEFLGPAVAFIRECAQSKEDRLLGKLLGSITQHQTVFVNAWKARLLRKFALENLRAAPRSMTPEMVVDTLVASLGDLPEIVWQLWRDLFQRPELEDFVAEVLVTEVIVPILNEMAVSPEFACDYDTVISAVKHFTDAKTLNIKEHFARRPLFWKPPVILELVYTGQILAWYSLMDLTILRFVVLGIKKEKRDFYLDDVTQWKKDRITDKDFEMCSQFMEGVLELDGSEHVPEFPSEPVMAVSDENKRKWRMLVRRAQDENMDITEITDWLGGESEEFRVYALEMIRAELRQNLQCREVIRARMRNWKVLRGELAQVESAQEAAAVHFGLTQTSKLVKNMSGTGEKEIAKLFGELLSRSVAHAEKLQRQDLACRYQAFMRGLASGTLFSQEKMDKVVAHLSLRMIGLTVYAVTIGFLQAHDVSAPDVEFLVPREDFPDIQDFFSYFYNPTDIDPLTELRFLWGSFAVKGVNRQFMRVIAVPYLVRQVRAFLDGTGIVMKKQQTFKFFHMLMTTTTPGGLASAGVPDPDLDELTTQLQHVNSLCHTCALLPSQRDATLMALSWLKTSC